MICFAEWTVFLFYAKISTEAKLVLFTSRVTKSQSLEEPRAKKKKSKTRMYLTKVYRNY